MQGLCCFWGLENALAAMGKILCAGHRYSVIATTLFRTLTSDRKINLPTFLPMYITCRFGRANVQHIRCSCNTSVAPKYVDFLATTWPRLRSIPLHATVKPVAANSATGPDNPRKIQAHQRPNPRLSALFHACNSV
jgi:hypothetical protein